MTTKATTTEQLTAAYLAWLEHIASSLEGKEKMTQHTPRFCVKCGQQMGGHNRTLHPSPCGERAARLIAAAPEMLTFVRAVIERYEAALARCSPYTQAHSKNKPEPTNVADARALLAKIEGGK